MVAGVATVEARSVCQQAASGVVKGGQTLQKQSESCTMGAIVVMGLGMHTGSSAGCHDS